MVQQAQMRFLDLSSWQAALDFDLAAQQGIAGVIVKRSGGTSYLNPYFDYLIAEAQRVGMEIGTYPYLGEPTGDPGSPEEEADFFCDALPGGWSSPIFLDCEEANAKWPDLNDAYIRFRQRVRERTLIARPGIYTGNYWVQQNRLYDDRLAESPLWLASWQETLPPVPTPGPWTPADLRVWQYDSRASYGGMAPVDVNTFFGDRAAWRALGEPTVPDTTHVAPPGLVVPNFAGPMVTGYELHPYFWATWTLGQHGYPLGPAALYTDGRTRQLFENCSLGSNGRDEPVAFEGLGQAYLRKTGHNIVDWADVHPLVAAGVTF